MLKILKNNRGDLGLSLAVGLGILGAGYMIQRSISNAYKDQGKYEKTLDDYETVEELRKQETKQVNEYELGRIKKDRELRKALKKIKDPREKSRAVLKSLERD